MGLKPRATRQSRPVKRGGGAKKAKNDTTVEQAPTLAARSTDSLSDETIQASAAETAEAEATLPDGLAEESRDRIAATLAQLIAEEAPEEIDSDAAAPAMSDEERAQIAADLQALGAIMDAEKPSQQAQKSGDETNNDDFENVDDDSEDEMTEAEKAQIAADLQALGGLVDLAGFEDEDDEEDDDVDDDDAIDDEDYAHGDAPMSFLQQLDGAPSSSEDALDAAYETESDSGLADAEQVADPSETIADTAPEVASDDYGVALAPKLRSQLEQVRQWVRDAAPEARESVRWGFLHYEQRGHFAFVDARPEGIQLGFFRGARLDSPLLSGEDANVRTVLVTEASDASAIQALLKRAADNQ